MQRCALYHRVSTIDQRPELARNELRAAAKQRGYRVVVDEEETGSGATNDRPGLHRVMMAARSGAIDALLVWKLDRLSRAGVLDTLQLARELEACGVRLICTTQAIDFGGPVGSMLLAVLAAVAELERENLKERTRLGMAGARRRGVAIGRPHVALPDPMYAQRRANNGATVAELARELESSRYLVSQALRVCLNCGADRVTWIHCDSPSCAVPRCPHCGNHRGGELELELAELCTSIR